MKSWRSLSADALRGSALAALLLAAAPTQAAPLRAVAAEMAFSGNAAIAAHLKRAIPRYLVAELAANPIDVAPGARLVIRVTEVFLSSDMGGDADGGGMMMDALDGEALIVDARGTVLARKRVTGRMPPAIGPMGHPNEPRRIEALAESLAYWTVRELR